MITNNWLILLDPRGSKFNKCDTRSIICLGPDKVISRGEVTRDIASKVLHNAATRDYGQRVTWQIVADEYDYTKPEDTIDLVNSLATKFRQRASLPSILYVGFDLAERDQQGIIDLQIKPNSKTGRNIAETFKLNIRDCCGPFTIDTISAPQGSPYNPGNTRIINSISTLSIMIYTLSIDKSSDCRDYLFTKSFRNNIAKAIEKSVFEILSNY